MKVLLVGAGSKWGKLFTEYLCDRDCNIDLITSTGVDNNNVTNHKVDWNRLNLSDLDYLIANLSNDTYDLIFFNQNSGGGPNDKYFAPGLDASLEGWTRNFWIDCQLPYYLIKKLQPKITINTKIGWMLTGLINSVQEEQWKYGGYASSKTTNLHLMRSFSQYNVGIYFCLQPIWFPPGEEIKDCECIFKTIENITSQDNGKVFLKQGEEWEYFKKIH
jgi:hypothetical protein